MSKVLLLSIIVPMYNVAPYVERCLRSLANQDLSAEEYEIICVNDGSSDNCQEIVEQLQQEIPNIILINQENQGVSMARNNALAVAKGKYMMPIDPDDYVVQNSLKNLVDQADAQQLDVLYAAFEIFDVQDQSVWRTEYSQLEGKTDIGYDGYFAVRGTKVRDPDRSWAMLYRMDLLRKYQIDYPKNVPYLEDGLFLGKVFSVAKRVGYSDEDFYQRTTRMGSATNSKLFYSQKAVNGFISSLEDLKQFNNRLSQQKNVINHVQAKFIILALSPSCSRFDLIGFFKIYPRIKTYLLEINSYNINNNYQRMIRVLKINSFLFFLTFRFTI